jgi:hypothetical protein
MVRRVAATQAAIGGAARMSDLSLIPRETGVFNSTTQGYGITMTRATYTAASRTYADDGGAVLWSTGSVPDIAASKSRLLVTTSQAGGNVRLIGVQGMVASYKGIWNGEIVAGVEGVAQLVTTSTLTWGGYGVTAGVAARMATGAGTVVCNTYHTFAGFVAVSDMKGTVTQTGKTVAFLAKTYDTTNWSDSTARAKWGYGMYMPRGSVTQGLLIGDWVGSGAAGSGILIDTNLNHYADGQLSVAEMFGESTSALTSAYSSKVLRCRHIATASVDQETYGIMGQMVAKGATLSHLHAGVIGTFEGQTATVANGAYTYSVAAVMARVGGGGAITATKVVCGFSAVLNGAVMASGSTAAFACCGTTTGTWTYLLAANLVDYFFYAATGTAYEAGVKVTAITLSGSPDGVLKMKVATTDYYIPFYVLGDCSGA